MNHLYRKTPIMGWSSWNCFRTNISEEKIKAQIDALINTGLAECGYEYVNMDDGFFGGRSNDGRLLMHKERFPNGIKVIADYAHEKGLKAGIYSEGGDKTCGYYYDNEGDNGANVGLYGYEEQDLTMYLEEFGFDFIKVDWCGGLRLGLDEKEQYTKIGKIIEDIRNRTGRCIVYNICRWQFPGEWAAEVADSWRIGADIAPDFKSVLHQVDSAKPLARYCGPGHVNDLDMMQIGNGMGLVDEQTHFTMWCMMSTPLVIGCDLTRIKPETLEILKNKELIAINQDSACLQAYVIKEFRAENGELLGEVWIKDLGKKASNQKAVAFLNRSDKPLEMSLDFSEAGLTGRILSIRDLLKNEDAECDSSMKLIVQPHEAPAFKVISEYSTEVPSISDKNEIFQKTVIKISMTEAEELMKRGAYLIDVRERHEYAEKHIDGAINIPYTDIHAIAGHFISDKTKDIIVYCSTGKRSSQAVTSLRYLGYENIYYLGGIKM